MSSVYVEQPLNDQPSLNLQNGLYTQWTFNNQKRQGHDRLASEGWNYKQDLAVGQGYSLLGGAQ